MFASLPTSQWGAADVSISIRFGVYNVSLFGDTISNVTSWQPFAVGSSTPASSRSGTAACTSPTPAPRSCRTGWTAPGTGSKLATPVDANHLRITADHVEATDTGTWDFQVIGERTATAVLDSNGDVTFQSWTGQPVPPQNIVRKDGVPYAPWTQTVSEVATGKVLVTGLPNTTSNWSYGPSVHHEVRLASGKTLLTVCQNSAPLSYAG